jgi:ABC-type amino acid transport substrate-binding protein
LRVLITASAWTGRAPVSGLHSLGWELLSGFARARKMRLTAVLSSDDVRAVLRSGQAQVALALSERDVADSTLIASTEVVPSRIVVVTRRPQEPHRFLEDLRGKKIGVATGSAAVAITEAAKLHGLWPEAGAELEPALRQRRVDALLLDMHDALAAQRQDPELQLGVFVAPRLSVRFVLRAEGAVLGPAIDQYLTGIRSSGSWGVLMSRHLGAQELEALGRAHLSER